MTLNLNDAKVNTLSNLFGWKNAVIFVALSEKRPNYDYFLEMR